MKYAAVGPNSVVDAVSDTFDDLQVDFANDWIRQCPDSVVPGDIFWEGKFWQPCYDNGLLKTSGLILREEPLKQVPLRIEAVITCVNYGDFLAHTLVENIQYLDHVVVVTSTKDKSTRDLCNKMGVVCVDTDVFYEHGDKFNKGRGINIGLQNCRSDAWLLHMDADVILPHRFRYTLQMAHLDPTYIYGADRLDVPNYDTWKREKDKLEPQFENGCHIQANGAFRVSSRLLHGDYGYVPIGYFQLWHSSQHRLYPGNAGSSEHSDVVFGIQWPRNKRQLLPNCFVYHLLSENAPMGANWKGRKTKAFCPCHSWMIKK